METFVGIGVVALPYLLILSIPLRRHVRSTRGFWFVAAFQLIGAMFAFCLASMLAYVLWLDYTTRSPLINAQVERAGLWTLLCLLVLTWAIALGQWLFKVNPMHELAIVRVRHSKVHLNKTGVE